MPTENLSETVMTFGMHKGKTFAQIPRSYLLWAVENPTDKRHPSFQDKLERYLCGPSAREAIERGMKEAQS